MVKLKLTAGKPGGNHFFLQTKQKDSFLEFRNLKYQVYEFKNFRKKQKLQYLFFAIFTKNTCVSSGNQEKLVF